MLTSRDDYSTGLASGVYAGYVGGSVLLSDPDELGHSAKETIARWEGQINKIVLMGPESRLGQGVVSDIDYAPPVSGSITGTVTAAASGAPVAGVRVSAWGEDPNNSDFRVFRAHDATTATDGTYAIGHLERGRYWLTFSSEDATHSPESYPNAPGTSGHGDVVYVEEEPAAPTRVSESLVTTAAWEAQRVRRLAGADRYAVALNTSRASYRAADTAVIVNGEGFSDALSASALAGAYHAPLLLTRPGSLPTGVVGELRRLGVERVFIVGGYASVSRDVEDSLDAQGFPVAARIAGADRYEASAGVFRHLRATSGLPTVAPSPFVVRGDIYPDALSAAPFAYAQIRPILLVRPTGAPASVAAAVRDWGVDEFIVVGGTGSVPDSVLGEMGAAGPSSFVRLSGPDRYTTAAAVARHWTRPYEFMGVACGTSFADAMAGGILAGARGGALLLTPTKSLHPSAAGVLAENADALEQVRTFGGTASVSDATHAAVAAAVERD